MAVDGRDGRRRGKREDREDPERTESDKTKKSTATKAKHTTIVSDAKKVVKDSSGPGRLMMLLFVRVFIITHLFAFSLADSKDVRVFLNGNQDYIPKEVPALSTQQALQAVPKRLSDPRSETEGLSSTNNEEQENEYDAYAIESDRVELDFS